MVVPPAMAKDQSCQVSSQNSKNKGNFLTNNWGRAYPPVIAKLKKGRPSLRSGLNKQTMDKIIMIFDKSVPPIHRPSKILNHLSKTMHSAASLRKKGKTLSLPLHAHSKHMGRRKVLLGQVIF